MRTLILKKFRVRKKIRSSQSDFRCLYTFTTPFFITYYHFYGLYSVLQHLHCDCSRELPTYYESKMIARTRNLYSWPDPSKSDQFHDQNDEPDNNSQDPDKQPQHLENQVVCRQHEHHSCPSHHHKLFPICRYSRPPLVLNCESHQQVVHLKIEKKRKSRGCV